MRLQLRIKVGNDVQSDCLVMLGKLFGARYIIWPIHVFTGNSYTTYVGIEIDGSQELTPEHWEYIKNEEYTLRFIEPSVLPDEEEDAR